jgi:hypothetical protein
LFCCAADAIGGCFLDAPAVFGIHAVSALIYGTDWSKFNEDEKLARNLKGMGVSELEKRSIDDHLEFKILFH